jgi:hypothetical protein
VVFDAHEEEQHHWMMDVHGRLPPSTRTNRVDPTRLLGAFGWRW